MATDSEVRQARVALRRISAAAEADLVAALAGVDPEDRVAVGRVMRGVLPEILAAYGAASSALGADVAEMWLSELGVRPRVVVAPAPSRAQGVGAARWAMERADWAAGASTIVDLATRSGYRDTLTGSAHASRAAWARVPTGRDTCAFCTMLAGRGAVYRSSDTASAAWHSGCDCQIVLVSGGRGYPSGHDPDTFRRRFDTGRSVAEEEYGPNPSMTEILSGMRKALNVR